MSEAANPFAPPQAQVADIADAVAPQPVKLWSAQGRIGRLRYVAYNSLGYLVVWTAMAVMMGVAAVGAKRTGGMSGVALLVLVPLWFGFFVFTVLQLIKRCHDLGWNGWVWLVSLIPLVNLFFFLPIVFMPGRKDGNAYGAPPPPNRWYHWVMGTALPAVVLVGIVAAIAIPAYQNYTQRARAAESR